MKATLTLLMASAALAPTACGASLPPPIPVDAAAGTSHEGHDVVVLERRGTLELRDEDDPSDGYRFTHYERVLVRTPGGRHHARIDVPLSAWEELDEVWARSYPAGDPGEPEQLDPYRLAYRSAAGAGSILYSDTVVASFDVPGVDVGDVIELAYTIESERSFVLPSWRFDDGYPVRESRFVVLTGEGVDLGWAYSRDGALGALEPTRQTLEDGRTRWVWEQRDLDAVQLEAMGPSAREMQRTLRVVFSRSPSGRDTFASWEDVGLWYRDLVGSVEMGQARQALAEIAGAATGDTRQTLFERIRDGIRYVAIHEGLGAYRPHSPAEVLRSRYGDCKDMSTTLVGLYEAAGVRAWPALIGTRGLQVFSEALPSVSSFNHMIVAIEDGDGYLFVDPTSKWTPWGELPWGVQGQHALVVKAQGVELVQTPVSAADASVETRTWTLEGGGKVSLRVVAGGELASSWRARRDVDRSLGRVSGALASMTSGIVTDVSDVQLRVEGGRVEIRAQLRLSDLHRKTPAGTLWAVGRLFAEVDALRVPAERKSPVHLGPPRHIEDVVVLPPQLAAGVRTLPSSRALELEVARYERSAIRKDDGTLELRRVIRVDAPLAPPEAFPKVREVAQHLRADARLGLLSGGR